MIKGTFGTARVNRDLATGKRVRHDEQVNVTPTAVSDLHRNVTAGTRRIERLE
jgi:hypothetical protein